MWNEAIGGGEGVVLKMVDMKMKTKRRKIISHHEQPQNVTGLRAVVIEVGTRVTVKRQIVTVSISSIETVILKIEDDNLLRNLELDREWQKMVTGPGQEMQTMEREDEETEKKETSVAASKLYWFKLLCLLTSIYLYMMIQCFSIPLFADNLFLEMSICTCILRFC